MLRFIHNPLSKKAMPNQHVGIRALMRHSPLALAIIGLFIFGAVAVNSLTVPPGLTWNQPSASSTVVAGAGATTTTISFTATGKLPNAVVQLSPAFAGLVSVSPTNLGTVFQGQTVTLTLTANAPASSTPVVVQGSIQIQKQQNPPLVVYGSPLQGNLAIKWPSIAIEGVALTYPGTWQLNQDAMTKAKVIQLTNFGGAYTKGGTIPSGGAQISLPSYLLSSTTISQLIASDTEGDTVELTQQVNISGITATQVSSDIEFLPTLAYRRIAYYIPRGQVVYKLVLDYNLNDSNEAAILIQLQGILQALTFN